MSDRDFNKWAPRHLGPNDMATGQRYYHFEGGEQWMLQHGYLLDEAEKAILQYPVCAEEFLTQLKDGKVDLYNQTRYLGLLHDLYEKIRSAVHAAPYKLLEPLFKEAMSGLTKIADDRLEGVTKDEEEFYEYFEYSGFYGVVEWILREARDAADAGIFKKFAKQYSRKEGYQGDLFGNSSIVLTNPRHSEITDKFTKTFKYFDHDNAYFTKIGDNTWRFNFIKPVPIPYRLSLEVAALESAATVLSTGLGMDAKVEYSLAEYAYEV